MGEDVAVILTNNGWVDGGGRWILVYGHLLINELHLPFDRYGHLCVGDQWDQDVPSCVIHFPLISDLPGWAGIYTLALRVVRP